jgi:hypothetical protein
MSWDLTGNASTNESVNFVGTTDPHALVIRTNGQEAMRVDVNGNVGIGTNNPNSRLEIIAQDGLQIVGYQPFLTLNDSNNQSTQRVECRERTATFFFTRSAPLP